MLVRLSGAIVEHLDLEGPTSDGRSELVSRLEAHRCYAHGRRLWLEHGTKGSFDESRELFERAFAHDPSYVPALVSLAHLHAFRFNFTTEPETLEAGAGYARSCRRGRPEPVRASCLAGLHPDPDGQALRGLRGGTAGDGAGPYPAYGPYFAAWALQWASDPGEASTLHRHITGLPPPQDLHRWRRRKALDAAPALRRTQPPT